MPEQHGADGNRVLGAAELVTDRGVEVGYPAERGGGGPLVLGPRARLRSGTVLYTGSTIGADLSTGHGVVVREDCRIAERVSVWSGTVVDYACDIGDDVRIHSNCYIAQFTEIERGAFLAPGVSLANDVLPGDAESARLMMGPSIGAGAQLGVNVTVLPYVRIGEGAVVGAGAVVTRDLPPGCLAYGNPARVVGPRPGNADAIRARLAAAPALLARLARWGRVLRVSDED
ncbi:DapH/DapD/GlmU-related protein [Kineococcus xinjiangensis]|uniref:DapH/DapD/GlmU-related protein n=1 Tax=Kineococcus xinjiangensis TaxID=512762 RepID=UPI001B80652A|nr:DapH/DapD/GlmU-related protein [Kineococcus xinjiangensis]